MKNKQETYKNLAEMSRNNDYTTRDFIITHATETIISVLT